MRAWMGQVAIVALPSSIHVTIIYYLWTSANANEQSARNRETFYMIFCGVSNINLTIVFIYPRPTDQTNERFEFVLHAARGAHTIYALFINDWQRHLARANARESAPAAKIKLRNVNSKVLVRGHTKWQENRAGWDKLTAVRCHRWWNWNEERKNELSQKCRDECASALCTHRRHRNGLAHASLARTVHTTHKFNFISHLVFARGCHSVNIGGWR